jgi:hypothetical protein
MRQKAVMFPALVPLGGPTVVTGPTAVVVVVDLEALGEDPQAAPRMAAPATPRAAPLRRRRLLRWPIRSLRVAMK